MTVALKDVGEALYGDQWINPLADDLEVSQRTMRRWATGTADIPVGVWEDLLELMRFRREALDDKICQVVADFLPKSKISAINA
jgi:hypothetical protein